MVVGNAGHRARRGGHGQHDLTRALECFWHPVCSTADLGDVGDHPTGVRLLGRDLVVCRLGDGRLVALDDRCAHRSTRLSVGTVDATAVRCAHNGWRWDADGTCMNIPSLPEGPIPARARIGSYDVQERMGLVWVRIDAESTIAPPASPPWEDLGLRVATGEPYSWPIAAARRVESFVELAHGAWWCEVPAGESAEVVPLPEVDRLDGTLRYVHRLPGDTTADHVVVTVHVTMPATVSVGIEGPGDRRRMIWMTATPLDEDRCRCFWVVGHDDGDPDAVLEPHRRWLAATAPIVSSQVPGWFPLDASDEISVRSDLVSNVYRRWLRELVAEVKRGGPAAAARSLSRPVAPARGTATT